MTTTAATWFFREPEHNAYALQERVCTNFWDERVGDISLWAVRAEPPFHMRGEYNRTPVELEWEPNRYLRLQLNTDSEATPLVAALSRMLDRKPLLRYQDANARWAWEWHVTEEGGRKRWQEIQGRPAFRNPTRLDREE